ncbi:hypothetical protein Ocin01_11393, partial [Orchesella cincta]
IVAAISIVLFGYTLACRPVIRLYESEGYGNEYVEVAREFITIKDEANLTAKMGIKNYNLRTCPEGMWLGYEFENFTGSRTLLSGKSNASAGIDALYNNCLYQNTGNKIRSVKIVGSTASYGASALVTYPQRSADGPETTYLNDTRVIGSFTSLLIIGNEEVELFTNTDYSGLSVCIRPNNGYINYYYDYEEKNDNLNGTYVFTYLSDITRRSIQQHNLGKSIMKTYNMKLNTLLHCTTFVVTVQFVAISQTHFVSAESQTVNQNTTNYTPKLIAISKFLFLYHRLQSSNQHVKVTVTAEPPASISPPTDGSNGDNEVNPAIESLDFRLRYVEQVQLIFSKNIMELKNKVKALEDTLNEYNITITPTPTEILI